MTQSRKQSAIEVLTSTAIGSLGSFLITYLCILYIRNPALAALVGVVLCTIWSLARGYTIRRYFARRQL